MLDFIEFFKNEEKYHRQVIFDGKNFKVGDKIAFKTDKHFNVLGVGEYKSKVNHYSICKIATGEWYILKDGYFGGNYFTLQNQSVYLKSKEVTANDIQAVMQSSDEAIKKFKKRSAIRRAIAIIIILSAAIVFVAVMLNNVDAAVNIFDNCSSCSILNKITYDGTYYYKRPYTDEIVKSTYIKLNGGKWEDSDGYSGKYKISDGKISFYINDSLFLQGTISGGEIRLESFGTYITYVKQ